jgi:hypothetical protein
MRGAPYSKGRHTPRRIMSGWNSLESVSALHTLFQAVGSLIALLLIATGLLANCYWHRWGELVAAVERVIARFVPRFSSDTGAMLHNAFSEVAILGTAALLALSYAAHSYGQRKAELVAADQAAQIARIRADAAKTQRVTADLLERAHARAAMEAATRHAADVAELQQRLRQAESRRVASVESLRWEVKQAESRAESTISRLERQLGQVERRLAALTVQRRLTMDEKDLLIETLRPFAGQKVSIAAIDGNEDDKVYATDFVEVFEAAGWQHPDVTYRRWDRDPIGVEITLNEADGRAGRINVAIGALINVVRKLGLTDGNTIYMNGEVPAGQVEIKIGKKLQR